MIGPQSLVYDLTPEQAVMRQRAKEFAEAEALGLRKALADSSEPAEKKQGLLRAVFAAQVGAGEIQVFAQKPEAVRSRHLKCQSGWV